jgi:WD40 repeat protein
MNRIAPHFHMLISLLAAILWPTSATAQLVNIQAARTIHCQCDDERPTVVTGVAMTPNGQSIIAATDDHAVSVWEASTGQLQHRFVGHSDWTRAVAFSSDASFFASGANDRTICLWDVALQQPVTRLPALEGAIASVGIHGNGQQIAVVGFARTLHVVNASTGQITQEYECAGDDQRAVVFSPDGIRMAAAGRNGRIRVWNVLSGTQERDIETDGRPVRTLVFSPDSRQLAAAGDGPKLRLFDAATGVEKSSLDVRPAKIFVLAFMDNQRLASAGSDNQIRLWDLDSGQPTALLVGHTGTVTSLATSADGTVLVSGSYDTTVRIWELGGRQQQGTASRYGAPPVR